MPCCTKLRRPAIWALAILALVALGAWVTSLWVAAGWSNGPRVGGVGTVDLTDGGVVVGMFYSESIAKKIGEHVKPGLWISAGSFQRPIWVYDRARFPSAANTAYEYIRIPLWPVVVTLMGLATLTWTIEIRANRRLGASQCPTCGYDRRGLTPDAKCPECGTVPTPASK